MMRSRLILLLLAGVVGAGAGWVFTETALRDDKPVPAMIAPDDLIGMPRPDFALGSTNGEILQAADFDGQVLLINFWATWCAPCREEMPMLSDLHERMNPKGFQVLGIALDDVQQARDFVQELRIRYPVMVGGADVMAVGLEFGNHVGLLPYSVLVDRQGIIRWTVLGEVDARELEEKITALL